MKHPIPIAIGVYVVFLVVLGVLPSGMSAPIAGYVLFCILTGFIEEGVFCGLIFRLLSKGDAGGDKGVRDGESSGLLSPVDETSPMASRALIVTAVLFGLAHLTFADGIGLGVLKALQAFFFSLCMVGIYMRTRKLWVPMLAHAAFDLLYFAAPYAATGSLPPYAPAHSLDANLVILAATTLFFAIFAIIIVKFSTNQRQ